MNSESVDCSPWTRSYTRFVTSPSAGFRSARWTTTCTCLPPRPPGAQLLIDAADDLAAIQGLLADAAADTAAAPKLTLIATTHQHWDHVRALPGLVEATGAKTAAGTDDAAELPVKVDVLLDHGDVGNFDGFDVTAVHLRGHTRDRWPSCTRTRRARRTSSPATRCSREASANTQKDPERFAQLLSDVTERLFDVYPDDTVVHPGHGKPTTLGAERPHLEEWRARGW